MKFFQRTRVRLTLALLCAVFLVFFVGFKIWLGKINIAPDDVPLWTIDRSEVNRMPASAKNRKPDVQDGSLGGLAFSYDGKTLKTGVEGLGGVCPFEFINPPVRWWDTETGKLRRTCPVPLENSGFVVMSSDERYLATWAGVFAGADNDISIHVFDAKSGKQLWMKKGKFGSALAFAPDGQSLVGCMDSTGFEPHNTTPNKVPVITESKIDYSLKVWDVATGMLKKTLIGKINGANTISFSANGKLLAVEKDGTVEIWDTNRWRLLRSTVVGLYWRDTVAFFPDAKRLAIKGEQIEIWDWRTGKKLLTLENSWNSKELTISSDGKFITGNERKFFLTNGDEILSKMGYDPSGQSGTLVPTFSLAELFWRAVLAHKRPEEEPQKGIVLIWDAATGKIVKRITTSDGLLSVAFAPDNKTLASMELYGRVRLWNTSDLYH